ncbi:membrane metallo-endopeptidase-like 1 isoform X1 [Nomia melanderi]|uniref:membrane metallo-endopeptidase-like 1 isoform X1 n=1 Tax=Nomia melanderi TaxID=2448451 RepID=UPI003FCCD29D
MQRFPFFRRCQLTVVASFPASLSVARIWRTLVTTNNTEAQSERDYRGNKEQRVCETAHCNEIARRILDSMDTSVDPCEDFYQYACGSWEEHNAIPDNEVEWSEDDVVTKKTYERIRDVLEEPDKPTDILPVKMARKLYRSCMNVEAIERRGIKPIQEILNTTGGWPIAMPVKEWSSKKFPWQKIDRDYVALIGNSAFYNIEYEIDQNDTTRYVLTIDQDTEHPMGVKREVSSNVELDRKYLKGIYLIIHAFAKEKGYRLRRRQLIDDMTKMLEFEIELNDIIETDKVSHAANNNSVRMTIEELQMWYDSSGVKSKTAQINFLEVMQYTFKRANVSINATEPIVVYNPMFLHKLARLLGNTSQRALVNYVQWNMINNFLSYTTQEMKDIVFNMSYSSYNISNYMPRWKFCVLNMEMEDAVSYMFVKKYISDDVIAEAKKMVQRIKEELGNRIMRAQWLSSSVKRSLSRKLDTIEIQIGYPEWYKDDQAMIQFYKGLNIGQDYFQNLLNCAEHELIKGMKDFRKPVVRTAWLDFPITVNAFYTPAVNTMLIPAAELQDPFFTPFLPDAITYAVTGFIIGHELSHGFDNEGIKYDVDGYMSSWISQDIIDEYNERASCFVDQFNNYTLDVEDENGEPVQVDGKLTEDENLADAVGVQVAFAAYKKLASQKPQTKLPGLENVTDDQLFFIEFAHAWCSSVRPLYAENVANSDEHSPPKYRIIGSLTNMAAFTETFQCSQNSPMNPPHKCNLWN